MNLRRVFILLGKEFFQGQKNFLFIFALVVPVVFTLLVTLIFGTFFSGRSRLGIADQGASELVALAQANPALIVHTYPSDAEMEAAAARGAIDLGVSLPAQFDSQLRSGAPARVTVYLWGESQVGNRLILGSSLVNLMRQVARQEIPVEIVQVVLGTGVNIPWEKRLLPVMVMMSIILAGSMVPATSLVNEKTHRTLTALAVSPATLGEVFAAKGLLGVLLSVFTGLMILFLNQAFGGQPALLVGVLALGATFSAAIGIMLGALAKDINSLMAILKGLGIFLYAPGFVYMFPELPQWIGRLFPTYYIIQPVMEITQGNASLAEIAPDVGILVALILVSIAILAVMAGRTRETQAAA